MRKSFFRETKHTPLSHKKVEQYAIQRDTFPLEPVGMKVCEMSHHSGTSGSGAILVQSSPEASQNRCLNSFSDVNFFGTGPAAFSIRDSCVH